MLRLAIAQFRPRKAAYRANLEQVGQLFRDLARNPEPVDVLVLPETALTGYFVEGGVRELAVSAEQLYADLSEVHATSGAAPVDVIVGFYELWNTRLYNSGLAARLGGSDAGIRHVHRKVFLPTYGGLDEERFVDLAWGRAAIVVCEDAWHSIVPTMAALDGAQVVVVLSASPARGVQPGENGDGRPASTVRWERVAQAIAAEHGLFVVVAHLVGFEGGKAFPGGSLVVDPRGGVVARAPIFEDGLTVVTVDLDVMTLSDAPAVADPEAGGLTMREMQKILRGFRGMDVIGGDVVCFVPHLDPSQVTALHISAIMHDIVTIMAEGVARKG